MSKIRVIFCTILKNGALNAIITCVKSVDIWDN